MASSRRYSSERDNSSNDSHETPYDIEVGEAFDVLEKCLKTIPEDYGAFRQAWRVFVCGWNLERRIKEIDKKYGNDIGNLKKK